jgi:hypothetical protein
MDEQTLIKSIELLITDVIENYFSKPKEKTHHIIDYLFPEERLVYSNMAGLLTSMGVTFWEKLVKQIKHPDLILENKNILEPYPLPKIYSDVVNSLKERRKHKETWIDMVTCVEELRNAAKNISFKDKQKITYRNPPTGHGVDIYLCKQGTPNHLIEYVFDLKNVHPNVGDGKRFNEQLINWYSYRLVENPEVQIQAKIVIPFNPYSPATWWEFQGAKLFPLQEHQDVWIEDEFWNSCTNYNNSSTWQLIETAFSNVKNNVEFLSKYRECFRTNKRCKKDKK